MTVPEDDNISNDSNDFTEVENGQINRMHWSYLSPQLLSGGAGGAKIELLRQNHIKQYLELQGDEFVLEVYSVVEPVEIFWKNLLRLVAENGMKERIKEALYK
ncbi:hypothetical protein P7K49_019359 [Saguinus oedipus]|uniref:Uncharacterized protein n=1 Tax=Saguinus oedipus TaxID=9490 RepID=A0ABQ9UYY8_SAGOE|nr:hypothetical protein P7K49_019359 [Saguinus oedipus]